MRVELRAPHGSLTPVLIDRLGTETAITRQAEYDRIIFWVTSLNDNDAKQLRSAWDKCVAWSTGKRLQTA